MREWCNYYILICIPPRLQEVSFKPSLFSYKNRHVAGEQRLYIWYRGNTKNW